MIRIFRIVFCFSLVAVFGCASLNTSSKDVHHNHAVDKIIDSIFITMKIQK